MLSLEDFKANLAEIEEGITRACEKAGRKREEVRLMGVTKTFPREYVELARKGGINLVGENRVQELVEKFTHFPHSPEVHLIGHLQRNKAKAACPLVSCIHSIDKLDTARAVSRHCQDLGKVMDVLVEINTSHEESKFGLRKEDEYFRLLDELLLLPGVRVRGLMTLGPFTSDREASHKAFRALRLLLEKTRERKDLPEMNILSMGMSMDYEAAIAEGSTLVRIGTALFGGR